MFVLASVFLLAACNGKPSDTVAPPTETGIETDTETEPPFPQDWAAPCDAGDDAWVDRTMRLMWGRRPHGAAEVAVWREVVTHEGRDAAVRAMSWSDEYYDRWSEWLLDAMVVARTGDRAFGGCYNAPLLSTHDGSLSAHIVANGPGGVPFPEAFNGADVLRDALVFDDISVPYRVNLFTRMFKPMQGANVGRFDMERNRRDNFGISFMETYLNRNMTCMACHNSEFSITGDIDPGYDRTWEIPGLYEQALFGSSFGTATDDAYAVFKYEDLVDDQGVAPWGIYPGQCGSFKDEASVGDFLEHDAYFIEAFGTSGSVWQVERFLQEGVDAIGSGIVIDGDLTVEGPAAFAYLVAESIANQVWAEAVGAPLTIANYFPRNQAQRDVLWDLTDAFAESHFSLRELLVITTTNPYYNHGGPQVCDGTTSIAPIYNPWTVSEEDRAAQGNGAGELVHRVPARALVRAVHAAMSWPQPNPFLATTDPLNDVLSGVGAYMRESQPGFSGTDFQGMLAYEAAYASGASPSTGGAENGCVATPTYAGCASCDCEAATCAADPYCCEVQWDDACVQMCDAIGGGCGGGLAEDTRDYVSLLIDEAVAQGATVEAVVVAMEDRILGTTSLEGGLREAVEALVGVSLDTPIADALSAEAGLRSFGGALLMSPDFYLMTEAAPYGDPPALSLSAAADCAAAVSMLAKTGVRAACDGDGRLTW